MRKYPYRVYYIATKQQREVIAIKIAGIVRDSTVDGIGIRDVVFFQGCSHRCKGCQNPQTWSFDGGEHRFAGDVVKELSDSPNDITISGGEPLLQYQELLTFLEVIRRTTDKRVWLYTGSIVDPTKPFYRKLAEYIDVVVDGKYVEELKDKSLRFRGSSNQRIIDLPKSVKEREIVLWEETYEEI